MLLKWYSKRLSKVCSDVDNEDDEAVEMRC